MICNFKSCRRNAITVNKFVFRLDYGMEQNLWFGLPECFVQLVSQCEDCLGFNLSNERVCQSLAI